MSPSCAGLIQRSFTPSIALRPRSPIADIHACGGEASGSRASSEPTRSMPMNNAAISSTTPSGWSPRYAFMTMMAAGIAVLGQADGCLVFRASGIRKTQLRLCHTVNYRRISLPGANS